MSGREVSNLGDLDVGYLMLKPKIQYCVSLQFSPQLQTTFFIADPNLLDLFFEIAKDN